MGNSMSSFHGEQRGRYEPPGPSVVSPPILPVAPPPHQLVRQLSLGTAASSRSRQASTSTALFNAGEDDDESYIYFMGGEVVMHREDRRVPSPIAPTGGSTSGSVGDATDDGPRRVGGIPDHILAEVGVLHNNASDSFDAMDNDDELFHSFDDGGGGVIVDPPEASSLQAILHVHETPRTDNLSREQGSREDTMAATAPIFPHLRLNG
jgi:hypothetical protein